MKFYRLYGPSEPWDFAEFSSLGTWAPSSGFMCNLCGYHDQILVEPLQIEWHAGSDNIGDFSCCRGMTIVNERVRRFLRRYKFECDFGRVEVLKPDDSIWEPDELRAEKEVWGKKGAPRVPFPYEGPKLHWLMPRKRVRLDESRSNLGILEECMSCGNGWYEGFRWPQVLGHLSIKAPDWQGEKIFLPHQLTKLFDRAGPIFLIESVLTLLQEAGFTNLHPQFAGRIE